MARCDSHSGLHREVDRGTVQYSGSGHTQIEDICTGADESLNEGSVEAGSGIPDISRDSNRGSIEVSGNGSSKGVGEFGR